MVSNTGLQDALANEPGEDVGLLTSYPGDAAAAESLITNRCYLIYVWFYFWCLEICACAGVVDAEDSLGDAVGLCTHRSIHVILTVQLMLWLCGIGGWRVCLIQFKLR